MLPVISPYLPGAMQQASLGAPLTKARIQRANPAQEARAQDPLDCGAKADTPLGIPVRRT